MPVRWGRRGNAAYFPNGAKRFTRQGGLAVQVHVAFAAAGGKTVPGLVGRDERTGPMG